MTLCRYLKVIFNKKCNRGNQKSNSFEDESLSMQLKIRAGELSVAIDDDDSKKISYLMVDIARIYDALQTNLILRDKK